jgi:hypothetical protein
MLAKEADRRPAVDNEDKFLLHYSLVGRDGDTISRTCNVSQAVYRRLVGEGGGLSHVWW